MRHSRGMLVGAAVLGTVLLGASPAGAEATRATQDGSTVGAGAGSVEPAACRDDTILVRGGKVGYTECTSNRVTVVNGWVRDTRPDGRCAQAYAIFQPNGEYRSRKACGWRNQVGFTWRIRGASDARVYLRIVPG